MHRITIFTDGSSRGNPGPGGWGTVIVTEQVTELGGAEKNTTNNRMELTAALHGLKYVAQEKISDSEIVVYTDSSYLIKGATVWIKGWKRNGWITATKQDVLNKDLWMDIDEQLAKMNQSSNGIHWKYVGGHVGIAGNERCDHIATDFADGVDVKLYAGPIVGYDLPNILDISYDPDKAIEKKKSSSRSSAKAYSYVSAVSGVVQIHATWSECEKRVKGVRGARFKKSLSKDDESQIVSEFRKN